MTLGPANRTGYCTYLGRSEESRVLVCFWNSRVCQKNGYVNDTIWGVVGGIGGFLA